MICPKTVNQKQYHTQEKGQGNSQGSSCATGLVNNQSIGKKIGGEGWRRGPEQGHLSDDFYIGLMV